MDSASAAPPRTHRTYWWKETLIMGAFYVVYSWTRNQFGSAEIAADGVPEQAFNNAERLIRLERLFGLFHEETVQDWFLSYEWFIRFWNTYYGTAHFIVTLGVFWILFVKRPNVFPQWRNTLAITTALAIVGFSLFPVMPPRLLDAPCPGPNGGFGGACISSPLRDTGADGIAGTEDDGTFGFVDTLPEFGGGLWTFESDTMNSISNQYAAMPSLHIGWASWCAFAMWPLLRRRWTKVAVLLYPAATLFCIVVTGNHYWIDGVGGQVALGIGALLGWGLHRWNQNRLDARHQRNFQQTSTRHTGDSADVSSSSQG
ncbi:MAG: phosphatase PAP2 family protein [Acidimicrobiia bacterium]|nr:phosphatase PAP2 family protein [Acidimicrobiia bacterium]